MTCLFALQHYFSISPRILFFFFYFAFCWSLECVWWNKSLSNSGSFSHATTSCCPFKCIRLVGTAERRMISAENGRTKKKHYVGVDNFVSMIWISDQRPTLQYIIETKGFDGRAEKLVKLNYSPVTCLRLFAVNLAEMHTLKSTCMNGGRTVPSLTADFLNYQFCLFVFFRFFFVRCPLTDEAYRMPNFQNKIPRTKANVEITKRTLNKLRTENIKCLGFLVN